ncbi:MAG: response regulator, partial [Bacteroidales bacterium]|nr:response regulator [Bacteroidales bacterium]
KKIALVFKDISDIVRNESLLMIQRNLAYAILNSKTVKEFLSVAAFELSRILDITGIYIAQLYNKSDYLSITGYINKFHKNWTEPHKGSLEGYVYDSEHSVLVSREEIFDLCQKGEINFHGNIPALWMGVPFSGENSSCGVIAVVNMENQNAFSKTDLSIIELIANETKIFLDKKRSEENTIKITKAITESPSSIIITDRMGVIEYVNPKFTSLTGYTPEEVIGGKPSILKSGDTPDLIYKSLWGTITSGQEWRGELKNRKKSGDFYWEDVSISPVFDDNGYISHYVAVKEDITDRRQLISELIRARDKAEESDRLKTSFIQNISHEMRTPMNGVMGFIDLLRDNSLMDSERMEFLDTIEKCGNRMLYIINDLIDISKIEAGIMQVNRRNFKPKDLLRDLVNFFTPEAGKDGLTLIMKADNIDNLEITSDYEKIYAALSNLIKNAIKFTDKGRVSLRAELNRDTIDFIVTDTGIGIPEQAQKKIFDRFARVDNSNIKRYEGTGLGLSIVKGYAELLGGSVEVESEEGSGSAFRFTIPLGQHAPDGENNLSEDLSYSNITEHREKEMTKVLIAEDEETNRLYLKTLLKKRNYELITATNGKEAVDLFAQNRDIRLVLMDIRMPVMDGYEATREIREMDKDVVIIAQTAYASAADREKVIEAGCNGYILKPIRKEELFEVIDSLLTEN